MDDIKSAFEIAMEKVNKLGELTDEERLKWKYVPEGEKLAARYLGQDLNLAAELNRYDEDKRKHVSQGAEDILIRSINLPKDDLTKRNNKKAMDGLKNLKSDKVSVENVYSKIRRIFSHYMEQGEQQRRQAYQSLKTEFEDKMQQAIQQRLGPTLGAKVDAETEPQFHDEWRRMQNQLDLQYLNLLDEYKQELLEVA